MLPRLLALATAAPERQLEQEAVTLAAQGIFDSEKSDIERLSKVFENAGVARRYTPMPLEWFKQDHGWPERMAAFREHALDLLEDAARTCLAAAKIDASEVDALVVVSTTGVSAPSLDAFLLNRLPFRGNLKRLPIFGLGCAGGVLGLSRAAELAQAAPGSRVLLLVVELCTLTFRAADQSKSNIVAAAIFGDGAAAALLSTEGSAADPALLAWGEQTWPASTEVMGWHIEDDGLGVLFSPEIPGRVMRDLGPAADAFLTGLGMNRADLAGYIMHPGGAKVVEAMEQIFGLEAGAMTHARHVLSSYGNMSAATVLFVLERALEAGEDGKQLMAALGPGFTAAFLLWSLSP
jgi:alkylresorcinol/alkylpyrone synthase